jgi:formate hydrogenlyase subunit 3/multisubunit Na+/H+ antiporter MnhD subunit
LQALIAKRLKLVVAYSTVAQVGYLFMCFPLWAGGREALTAFVYLAVAHAFAKSALFLACEQVQRALGDDQMSSLSRPELPGAVKITFALAAVSLVGLPPSGGFIGKWLLLDSTLLHGPTVWTVAVLCGTLLSAAAMARVLARFFAPEEQAVAQDLVVGDAASWRFSLTPLLLAAAAVGIGLLGAWPAELVNVGETVQ